MCTPSPGCALGTTELSLGRVPACLPRPRLAVVTAFTLALLAPARSEAGPVPLYADLPVGRVTSPAATSRPATIRAGESVAGVVVARGPDSQVTVDGGDAAIVNGAGAPSRAGPRPCVSQPLDPASSTMDPDVGIPGLAQRPQEWEGALVPQAVVWPAPRRSQVTELHVERVVERDGATSLESTDVWVDTTTLGVRLVAKALLPLRQVGSAPGGLKLFAGRDERPDGKRFLQFIVLRSAAHVVDPHASAIFGTRGGSVLPTATCSHARVALTPNKPGESASLHLTTTLPPSLPDELPPALPVPEVPPREGTSGKNDLRVRPLRIHVSVSQTTRDDAPVLAVSAAWAGPEVVERTDPESLVAPAPPPFMPASTKPSSDTGF